MSPPDRRGVRTTSMLDRWEVAYQRLKEAILSGELGPGDRVLEVPLATRYGVSRGPIREALRVLETEGLIVRHQRQGSYVTPLDDVDVREIYEVRWAVEPVAIELSLSREPRAVAASLERSLGTMRDGLAGERFDDVAAADMALHGVFYEWSGNRRLAMLWDTLRSPLQLLVRMTGGPGAEAWATTIAGHEAIVVAAIEGDIEACVREAKEHLALARDRYLKVRRG